MFIHISTTRDTVEVLNIAKIVKIYEMGDNQVRINMIDGSYTVTNEDLHEISETIEEILA